MQEIYVKSSREFKLQSNQLLRLLKPLYGLSQRGDYLHETIFRHLHHTMGMTLTAGDLSLFFKVVRVKLSGMVGTYVDETLSARNEAFVEDFKIKERKFETIQR